MFYSQTFSTKNGFVHITLSAPYTTPILFLPPVDCKMLCHKSGWEQIGPHWKEAECCAPAIF